MGKSAKKHAVQLLDGTSSDKTGLVERDDCEADGAESSADAVTDDELRQMRQEKIASIRNAIEAGAYDSEELLERAMLRMLQSLDLDGALDDQPEQN